MMVFLLLQFIANMKIHQPDPGVETKLTKTIRLQISH